MQWLAIISSIFSRILKNLLLVYSIDKAYLATKPNLPDPMYQTKSTEPNYQICSLGTKWIDEIYETKTTELNLNLPNKMV